MTKKGLVSWLWSYATAPTLARLAVWLLATQWLAYWYLVPADANQRHTLLYLAVIFLCKSALLKRLEHFPGGRSAGYRLAIAMGLFAAAFFIILIFRLGYARSSLFLGMGLLVAGELVISAIREQVETAIYWLIPPVCPISNTRGNRQLHQPSAPEMVGQGTLVIEPDADISREWLQFIARESASGRHVMGRQQLQEKINGYVASDDLPGIELETFSINTASLIMKRAADIAISLFLLPFVLPVAAVVALLIRMESSGKVLFRQERIGRGNQSFRMYKFRSMYEELGGATRFANAEKDRITRVGYFIRATHLDELPQLFNVLKGDMSLVGPRPEQPAFVAQFEKDIPFYRYRHLVQPGITGWAQVCQGYVADTDATKNKLAYDFFYLKNMSLWLDVLVLARTVRSVLLDRHPD